MAASISGEYCTVLRDKDYKNSLQVLPGRTHPMMNSTGTGGFLLHATKVYVQTVHVCSYAYG